MVKALSLLLAGLLSGSVALCEEAAMPAAGGPALSADEVVHKANIASYYAGDDGRAKVTMTITDSRGRTRTREFTILRMDVEEGGEQRFYVYFHRPPDVAKTTYLVWKHPGKDDDRWLYLPALDLDNRVAASDKRTSFVGSDFLYEDVSGRGEEEDEHELLGEENGMYVIKSTPRDPAGVEFAYFKVWIDAATFLPMKAEYYNAQGVHYRTVEALQVEDVEGHPTATRMKASDLEGGGFTVMEFSGMDYDVGLEEDIFEDRYLRRPPRRWLR